MKKHFIFILITFILMGYSLFPEQYDIRKLNWGMSFEQVQKIEGLENNFYKEEILLGIKVEVLFGCNNKGLYSVTYSSGEPLFAQEARKVMIKKYGEAQSDFDYSYLLKIKRTLKKYPELVINSFEKNDLSNLDELKDSSTVVSEKKILRNALTKRDIWESANTVALLLETIDGSALSYWYRPYHLENKKQFNEFFQDLKKNAKIPEKKKKDEVDKF